jgi:ABC-2 type transport system ATP-binding protein
LISVDRREPDPQPTGVGPAREGEILLEAEHLTKDYGAVRAVDDLSFSVARGEIVGLLGPNGAGKSTAMRILVGYQVPTAGTVRIAGGDIFREGARLKRQLGYLPENPPMHGEMRVGEYLAWVAGLKGLRGAMREQALAQVRERLGLQGVWRRQAQNLSRGFRQRVGLAQGLVADPPLLILDEPATGLDPNQIADLRRLLAQWRTQKAILLSTHILSEALQLCDRVLVLSRGRLVASESPQMLAGRGAGRVKTVILVRGAAGDPLKGFGDAGLTARCEAQEGADALWRLEGEMDRAGRLNLMTHLAGHGWDLVEWSAGLSALEQAFRRLTLEEGQQR